MATLTHDTAAPRVSPQLASGLMFAVVASASFGLSGSLGRGLMDLGWTAGAATLVRVAIAAAVLIVPGVVALRGRWDLVRRSWAVMVAYGAFAVAGAQLFYFMAVQYLPVSVALLIEYLAPVVVVLFMWLRHGHRPTRLTLGGAGIAFAGLVLLLDVLGGGEISLVGIMWALGAMVGASVYFILSGDDSNGLPPLTLAAGGMVSALAILSLAAVTGIVPIAFATGTVQFVPFAAPWWLVVGVLGVITAGVSYVAGIAANRRLGSRLGSFVALAEVLFAALFAWFLLGQVPGPAQIAGALLVVAGVVVVKLGERPADSSLESLVEPPAVSDPPAPVPV